MTSGGDRHGSDHVLGDLVTPSLQLIKLLPLTFEAADNASDDCDSLKWSRRCNRYVLGGSHFRDRLRGP